jgi:ATP-dependent exoDNAse (exonuclease V) beta subunit
VIINKDEIETHIENLLKPEILKIILPQPSSYSELPFLSVVDGKNVYGVIDRVIIENGICRIYDFKTGKRTKISDNDILQIDLYKSAVRNLFNMEKTEQFIIFTFQGIIKQVQP